MAISSNSRNIVPFRCQPATPTKKVESKPVKFGESLLDDPSIITFNEVVSMATTPRLEAALRKTADFKRGTGGSIKLLINTPGGEINAGRQAIHFINGVKSAAPVDTIVMGGLAASLGSMFFLAGDRRIMTSDAVLMVHGPNIPLSANQTLDIKDVKEIYQHLTRKKDDGDRFIHEVTGLPLRQVAKMTDKDTYIYPLQALKTGFATHVLTKNPELALTKASVEGLSDREIARRDRKQDYTGLKTEPFDPQLEDSGKLDAFINQMQKEGQTPFSSSPDAAPSPVLPQTTGTQGDLRQRPKFNMFA